MSELRVVAVITASEGSASIVRDALTGLVGPTRAEEGSVSYELFESGSAAGTFIVVETWRSQGDLDAHMGTAHIQEALRAIEGHLAAPIAIHPLAPLA